jgi:hypothetical protein
MGNQGEHLPVLVIDGANFSPHLPSVKPSGHRGQDLARCRQGSTLSDQIVEIIRDHGPGGIESEDGVLLELV